MSSIVEVSVKNMVLCIRVCVDDLTAERAIIASNVRIFQSRLDILNVTYIKNSLEYFIISVWEFNSKESDIPILKYRISLLKIIILYHKLTFLTSSKK